MSDYSKWFWDNCDELNKDTSFAHSLSERCWNHQQKKISELERKMSKILDYLDGKTEETWKSWKEKADTMDQCASNAYEDAYWFVKNIVENNTENTIEEKE